MEFLDVVILTKDLPDLSLRKGQVGTMSNRSGMGLAFLQIWRRREAANRK